MTVDLIHVQRLRFTSSRSFEEVLALLQPGIGRPDMRTLGEVLLNADSYTEFADLVQNAVGTADLLEFLRIDLGIALRKDPSIRPYRITRIIAGNPLIMKELTRHVPDAGSYAPVTILVYEQHDGVHLCYDSMTSLLASHGSAEATSVASSLDAKVIALLESV